MEDFLKSDLFKIGAVLVVAAILGKVVWSKLFPPKAGPLMQRVRCSSCGWTGTVGKHNRRCSKCASTTLEDLR